MFGINFLKVYMFAGLVCLSEASVSNQRYKSVPELSEWIDPSNVINTTTAQTMVSCSKTCGKDTNCEAFYYTPETKECQTQNARTSRNQIGHGLVAKVGTLYYQIPLVSAAPFVCPTQNGGWVTAELPDGTFAQYYLNNSVVYDQPTSVAYCQALGANLIKIVTGEKMTWYLNNIIPCPDVTGSGFWIAGKNTPTNPDHLIYDGDVVPLIPGIWYPDRPNALTTQNCLQSIQPTFSYMIDDKQCDFVGHQILCEKLLV